MNNQLAINSIASYLKDMQIDTRSIRNDVHNSTHPSGHDDSPYILDILGINKILHKDSSNEGQWRKVYNSRGTVEVK